MRIYYNLFIYFFRSLELKTRSISDSICMQQIKQASKTNSNANETEDVWVFSLAVPHPPTPRAYVLFNFLTLKDYHIFYMAGVQ